MQKIRLKLDSKPTLDAVEQVCPTNTFVIIPSSSFDSQPLIRDTLPPSFLSKVIDTVMFVSSSSDGNSVIAAVPFPRKDNKVHGSPDDAARDLNPVAFAFCSGLFVGAVQFNHISNEESRDRTVIIPQGKRMDHDEFAIHLLYSGSYPERDSGTFADLPDDHKNVLGVVFRHMQAEFSLSSE